MYKLCRESKQPKVEVYNNEIEWVEETGERVREEDTLEENNDGIDENIKEKTDGELDTCSEEDDELDCALVLDGLDYVLEQVKPFPPLEPIELTLPFFLPNTTHSSRG